MAVGWVLHIDDVNLIRNSQRRELNGDQSVLLAAVPLIYHAHWSSDFA